MTFLLSDEIPYVCKSQEIEINCESEGANEQLDPSIFLVRFHLFSEWD